MRSQRATHTFSLWVCGLEQSPPALLMDVPIQRKYEMPPPLRSSSFTTLTVARIGCARA
ncbi:MAG: hypothetical protein SF053_14175 [Bacteroidia bacterium]|nr:hypothetical protein [Bacteroidia bacterium]